MKKTIKIICMFLFVASLGFAQSGTSKTKATCKEVDKTFFQKMNNIDGLLTEKDLKISNFALTIITTANQETDTLEMKNSSSMLTVDMQTALRKLASGNKVFFEYIIAKDKSGQVKKLNPLAYCIK